MILLVGGDIAKQIAILSKCKVTRGAAAQIKYGERPFTLDVLQHRCDVLADVVIASAFPEIFGILVVTLQCEVGDSCEVLRIQFHVRWATPKCIIGRLNGAG
jgi:hypothetical protein